MKKPTIGLTVSVSDNTRNLVFVIEIDDPRLANVLKSTVEEAQGAQRWEIDAALLPGQGMAIGWEPRSTGRGPSRRHAGKTKKAKL